MIINNGPQETAEVIGGIDTSNSMRMNLNAQSYELLLSNLYSDPLGSTIRELCTNAVEANQGSGTTRKVVIQRLLLNLKVFSKMGFHFHIEIYFMFISEA